MDGTTHINIYSKGKTELGRWLSNFAHTPFKCVDGKFESIEGYWYWLQTPHERLREVWGYEAKKLGKELRTAQSQEVKDTPEFKTKILAAIDLKLKTPRYRRLLIEFGKSDLPFEHYYVAGNYKVVAKDTEWIIAHLNERRAILKPWVEKHGY